MDKKTIGVIVALVVVGGAGIYLHFQKPAAPATTAGINGSPNQGNLGGTTTGAPQTPQGDGTSVGQNLILGLNADAKLGTYFSAYNGMTVYTYAKDTNGVSNCVGECATSWPPYLVPSASDIHVPSTITGQVNTITRPDGSLQVTYNGMPLYFWYSDGKPGDTTGQGVGGVWFVAKP